MICLRRKSKYQRLKGVVRKVGEARFSLCNLCVLCVSVVHRVSKSHHRDTEDTKVAQRRNLCSQGWLPLVLRWRQRRQLRQHTKAERTTSPAPFAGFIQNHFQFATYLTRPERRRTERRVFPAATIYREQITIDQSRTNTLAINHAPQRTRWYRASTINYVRESALRQLNNQQVDLFRSSRFSRAVSDQVSPRQQSAFVPLSPRSIGVNTRREELTQVFRTHWRTHEHQPRVLSASSTAHETLTFHGPTQRKITRIQFNHSEELVWRRAQRTTITADSGNPNIVTTTQPAPVHTAVEEPPAQPAAPAVTRTTPPQITRIDPGLLDRLTDDVIRRVEQRARIERQRRGL